MRKKPTPRFARVSITAMPNAKSTWSGTPTTMIQSVLRIAGQTCVVGAEQVAVVGEADPARRVEQVVVRERQVHAHHERVAEEDEEADEPRAHQGEHEAAPRHAARLRGLPAIGHRAGRGRGRSPGLCTGVRLTARPPPCPACFIFASIVLVDVRQP